MGTAVVLIGNEAYAVGLAVALRSLVQHTKPLPAIFVIDTGLSAESRLNVEKVAPVRWVDVPPPVEATLKQQRLLPATAAYPSTATWLKLFLPQLLPAGVHRVLYMDCDMMAVTSVQPLLGLDLQGKLLAAVRDVGMPCGYPDLRDAGWHLYQPYFNAGLLLVDLQRLQAASSAIANIITQHGSSLQYHDQDVLNLLVCQPGASTDCPNRQGTVASAAEDSSTSGWLQLPLEWNAQGLGTYASFRTATERHRPALFASEAELQQYEQHPAVVHFTGPPAVAPSQFLNPWVPYTSKPWAYLCQHPFRDAFFAALDSTPWRGWRPSQAQVAEQCVKEMQELLASVAAQQPGFDARLCRQQVVQMLQARGCD